MELTQLEYFLETARREHITQTAEALNITQPALSKSISRLEDDLGVKLFDRKGKNVALNEYGVVVRRYVEQILYGIGDMRAELWEMKNGMSGQIKLGSSFPSQEPNWLLDCIEKFALKYPDVSFSLKQLPSAELSAALEQREIDIAISSEPILSANIDWVTLFTEPMGVILSASHRLAKKKVLSMTDLVLERFYCNNANSDILQLTKLFCARAGFVPNIHFEVDYPTFIGKAVSLGYGISIISVRGFQRNLDHAPKEAWENNIAFRLLAEEYCHRTCGFACLSDRKELPTLRAFQRELADLSAT